VLATSRERLQLAEEWVLDVAGLALPRDASDLEQAPASRLFLAQAQQVGAGGPLPGEERAAIVRICQLTQGLPLALLLAARWRHTLSCRVIAAVLERGLDLLTTREPGLPERHQSVRGVLAATWAQLAPPEQAALRDLSACRDGCTLEGAQAVALVTPGTLLALRDRALLQQTAEGRYTLHPLVRQFATAQAAAQPAEAAEAAERHARYYAALVERAHREFWRTPGATRLIGADSANAEAAWAWAAAHGAWDLLAQMRAGLSAWHWDSGLLPGWAAQLELAGAHVRQAVSQATARAPEGHRLLGDLLVEEGSIRLMCGEFAPGRQLLDSAAAVADELPVPMAQALQGRIAFWRASGACLQRDLPAAQRDSEQALALARTVQARELEAASLLQLGRLAVERHDAATAQTTLEQARTLLDALGDGSAAAEASLWLARSACEQGRIVEAQRRCEAVLHFAESFHRPGVLAHVQVEAGLISESMGRHGEAEQYFTQALAGFQALGFRPFDESYVLACLGRCALAQGDQPRARRLLTQALHTGQGASAAKGHTWALLGVGRLALEQGDEREAQRLAEQALSLAQRSWQRRAERFAQHLRGQALAGQGLREQAAVALHEALQLDQTLGYPHLAVTCRADLARVALAAGDLAGATAEAGAVLAYLERRTPLGTEEPLDLYLACSEVLLATGDPRAEEVLAAGHALLHERAAQFADAEQRRLFLERVPVHSRLEALWQTHQPRREDGEAPLLLGAEAAL
jgi:tetratricopeptide (TPR) repeat protein